MAEAQQLNVNGGGIPPVPPGAVVTERGAPPANQQVPGYVQQPNIPAFPGTVVGQQPTALSAEDLADFEAFKAFKAQQTGKPTPAVVPAPEAQSVPVSASAAMDMLAPAATSDPVLGGMLKVFESGVPGLDKARALGNALTHGDVKLIDTAYLREKGGAQAESLIEIAKGIVEHATNAAAAATQEIFTLAGGEQNWNAATAAFNKGAPDYLKQFVVSAMNSGNRSQIKAAAENVVAYAKQSGLVATPGTGFVQSGGGAPGSAQGLSKADFQKAHAALDPNARDYIERKGELMGRRQIGKQLGL